MFSADFISGSRDFTQHLTSGEIILIHSADACHLGVNCARALQICDFLDLFSSPMALKSYLS